MLKFISNSEKLSSREVGYWRNVFNANLMFASEVEFESNRDRFSVSDVSRAIDQSGTLEHYGNGIEEVKSDGSLRRGAEITTAPRRLYNMLQMVSGYKYLIDSLYEFEPVIKARAGWHNHVSLMHINGVEAQERPIPGVVLKNLLSLFKLYYPSISWFTSTLPDDEGAYTRYDNYCRHDRLKRYNSSLDLRDTTSDFRNTRYNCLNMNRLSVNENNDVTRFHIEFRFPDCSLFPVQMASFNIFIKAIILKAIELSKYGVIDSTISEEIGMLYNYKNSFAQNRTSSYTSEDRDMFDDQPDEDYRVSAYIREEYMERIRSNGKELIYLLEDEIIKIDKDSIGIISDLMDKPICMKFRDNNTNNVQYINEMYEEVIDNIYEKEDESLEEICKVISLGMIRGASSKEAWKERLVDLVSCKEDVNSILIKIGKIRKLSYSDKLGYYFE